MDSIPLSGKIFTGDGFSAVASPMTFGGVLVRIHAFKYLILYNNLRLPMQHDERGGAGHGGRSYVRRDADEGRNNAKEQTGDRVDKIEASDMQRKYDSRTRAHAGDNNEWRHDGFYELEVEAAAPRKRPAFSERKMATEKDSVAAPPTGPESRNHHDHQMLGAVRREEKGNNFSRGDKPERCFNRADDRYDKRGDRYLQRNEINRAGYQSREMHGGRDVRGRERFTGRYGERNMSRESGFQAEKWKHDLFDEANRSPTPKNEEEQIAKVEALLSL
ncbi:uncharacterized protein LOC135676419 isoform X2 [Musa acuminata AAA Group]|uniref:uncharacterized protein LOC103988020 isoform X2 n=1 Tax=Musa acuminata AAA Group TaxID=214697 RepID=UPI0031D8E4CA